MLGLPEGTVQSHETDHLFGALLAVTVLVLVLVFGLMVTYCVRYRAGSGVERGRIAEKTWYFEVSWTAATLVGFLGLFIWGADLYVRLYQPPPGALTINITAKQWMWKAEHPEGQREINALHVPVGRAVQLLMTSEDVIHDFGVPAFRLKHDVLPGRTEAMWFQADRPGTYQLFCDQYCGTDHAVMTGEITVMTPGDFEKWLAGNGASETLAAAGKRLFVQDGCSGCHVAEGRGGNGTVRAPPLDGVYGSPVPLSDGSVVMADDRYLRDSILMPKAQVVASYEPLMPSFAGVLGEDDLVRLVAYIKSIGKREERP